MTLPVESSFCFSSNTRIIILIMFDIKIVYAIPTGEVPQPIIAKATIPERIPRHTFPPTVIGLVP